MRCAAGKGLQIGQDDWPEKPFAPTIEISEEGRFGSRMLCGKLPVDRRTDSEEFEVFGERMNSLYAHPGRIVVGGALVGGVAGLLLPGGGLADAERTIALAIFGALLAALILALRWLERQAAARNVRSVRFLVGGLLIGTLVGLLFPGKWIGVAEQVILYSIVGFLTGATLLGINCCAHVSGIAM